MSRFVLLACLLLIAAGCTPGAVPPTATPPPIELRMYGWLGDFPQSILDSFADETGVRVRYIPFESQESALQAVRDGEVVDVLVLGNSYILSAAAEGLLRPIRANTLENFRNVALSFRDLVYDPGNQYSVPRNWGTTGIVYRTDLVAEPITSWNALWDARYRGKIATWETPRSLVGAALRTLGYPINTEDPAHLAAARERVLALRDQDVILISDPQTLADGLESGDIVLMLGGVNDALSEQDDPRIAYTLPQEGTMLWGDNFVVPTTSAYPDLALRFIDYTLRPEVSAQMIAHNRYATALENARPLLDAALRDNLLIFPPLETLRNAEVEVGISAETQALYSSIWVEFVAGREGQS